MSPGADIRSEYHARAILKLAPDAPPSTWRGAFQREAKAAHPDRGGDSERMRLVIEAYRFLKARDPTVALRPEARRRREPPRPARPEPPQPEAKAEPAPEPAAHKPAGQEPPAHEPTPPLKISIVEAFRGAERVVRVKSGQKVRVRLPSGLQTGDTVRFGSEGEHRLTIEVENLPRAELKGCDLWLGVGVSREFLKEGGRVELDTPLGPRKFWVSRTSAARGLYRVPGEGLPARGGRERGHLFLKFEADDSLNERPAKSLLARFAAVWAAE
ncbi:MAG TPA: DnaJ C-terminal domain-containing protein [Caulobacteraceae bacterium]|jgi:curved DNA-binding protein